LSDLLLVVRSYIVLQLMAVAAWPWLLACLRWCDSENSLEPRHPWPPDLAVPLAKSLGLVLVSYSTWLLGFIGVPIAAPTVWVVWAVLAITGYGCARTGFAEFLHALRKHRRAILIGEAVFLAGFLLFCRVRALTPDATFRFDERGRDYDMSASEKFTNLALLNSLYRERHMPPRDTWLAGYPINYYYFGHFEWAAFCKMAFIPPRIGFNIGQAATFALVAANAFSLALLLTRRLGAGLLAAYAVPVMGTPYGFLQLLLEGLNNYQYWNASRIVEGTIVNGQLAGPITEFPFFTFIVGDFHAHGISFHSYLLTLAIAFLFPFVGKGLRDMLQWKWWRREGWPMVLTAAFLGLLLAVAAMTNTWDVPSLGLLIAAILMVRSLATERPWSLRLFQAPVFVALVVAIARVLLFPHLATFTVPLGVERDPKAFYIGPLKWLGSTHLSEFKDYMVHFGFLLIPLTLAIHARLVAHVRRCEESRRRFWANLLGVSYLVALYVLLFAQQYFLQFFLAAMIVFALILVIVELRHTQSAAAVSRTRDTPVFAAVGMLSAVAFFLSLFAEVWVVDDGYAGPFERYNTVFKTYNVVWLLYGLSFAATAATILPRLEGGWRSLMHIRVLWPRAALAVVLAMGFVYPYAATLARQRELQMRVKFRERIALPAGPALDAVRYYASVNRDEYELIEWINRTIADKPVIAEGCVGTSAYSVQGRIATFTGLCTVVAWPQHEANWRSHVRSSQNSAQTVPVWSEMGLRIKDLNTLYKSEEDGAIAKIIGLHHIDYIVLGKLERTLYGPSAGRYLIQRFSQAFSSGNTIFLRTNRGD